MEKLITQVYAAVVTYSEDSKKWNPIGNVYGVSNIEVLHNEDSGEVRIVGWHLQSRELVLNCRITRHFKYNQATSTFHQWRDRNHIYGLNFPSIDESERFAHKIQHILSNQQHQTLRQQRARASSSRSSRRSSHELLDNMKPRKIETLPKNIPLCSPMAVVASSADDRMLVFVDTGSNEHVSSADGQYSEILNDVTPHNDRSGQQVLKSSDIFSSKVTSALPLPSSDTPPHGIPPPPPLPEANKTEPVDYVASKLSTAGDGVTLEDAIKQTKLSHENSVSSTNASRFPKPAAAGGDFIAELQMALAQTIGSSRRIRPSRKLSCDTTDSMDNIQFHRSKKDAISNPLAGAVKETEPKSRQFPIGATLPNRMHPDDLQALKEELFLDVKREIHKAKEEIIGVIHEVLKKP